MGNSIIAFKSSGTSRWCSDVGNTWDCTRDEAKYNERFRVVNAGGGKYAFRSLRSGRYCADEDHHNRIICNRNRVGQWEKFMVESHGSLNLLKGGRHKHQKYCRETRTHRGHTVVCDKGTSAGRESDFYIKCVDNCDGKRTSMLLVKPGRYRIKTTAGPRGGNQPAGWGLSAWNAHGARRNHASSWVATHSGNHWPMIWRLSESTRKKGTY